MAPRIERHGQSWIISQAFTGSDGIERTAFWGRAGAWVNEPVRIVRDPDYYDLATRMEAEIGREIVAATFELKQAAEALRATLPPHRRKAHARRVRNAGQTGARSRRSPEREADHG